MVPVETEKVPDVAPAATVADPGTVRVVLLFVRVTLMPPDGAGPFSPIVHVEVPELLKVDGEQDRDVMDGNAPPVTVPPVAFTEIPLPAAEAAIVLVTPMEVVLTPAAMVRLTTATVPFEITPAFMPAATQV
jgi:hypothetical protein